MGFKRVLAGLAPGFFAALTPMTGLAATDLGTVQARDPIAFVVDGTTSGELAVELDGVDVTEFTDFTDGILTLDPATPLTGGSHLITVYTFGGEGYEFIGEWSVTAEGAPALTSLTISATHEAEARRLNGDDDTVARSYGSAEAEFFDGKVTGSAAYVASSRSEEQPTGKTIDLEQYLIEFRQSAGPLEFSGGLGHQGFDFDDVLVSDLYSRGLTLRVETADQRVSFGVFGAAAAYLSGVENITGLSDADNRIEGYHAAFRPFAANDLRLSVIGQKGRGASFAGFDTGSGDGVGLYLDGSLAEGRLRYALGAAQTDWDADAEGGVFAEERGQAIVANLEYDVADGDWNALANRSLTLGLLYEQVDDTYMSLANPGLAVGQSRVRGTADYNTDTLWLSFAAQRQETNVNGPPTLETDEIYTLEFNGGYTLAAPVTSFGATGSASWDFGAVYTEQNRLETPLFAADPADFASVEVYGGYGRQFDYWSWRLGYSYIDYDDRSVFDGDTTSHRVDGTLDWSNDSGLALSVNTSADFSEDELGDYVDTQASLTASYDIAPGVWSVSGTATYSDAQSPYGSNGLAVTADLVRNLTDTAELVASAGYSTDDLAAETPEDEEWFLGLLLRLRTDVFR